MADYKRNHYVPQWYQYRFLIDTLSEKNFFYIDLNPEIKRAPNGKIYYRNSLLRWGPRRCFYEDDLYTTKFSDWESIEIEQKFFGKVDSSGQDAIEYFSNFDHLSINRDAFLGLLQYMSIQKLRTPKGLDYLSKITALKGRNQVLLVMQELQRMHCAIWTECVWSIADASQADTKFILSDHPVTVFNQGCFPASKWCRDYNDPDIRFTGTHTLFPLSLDKILILTNLSWVRNPYSNPLELRPHPQLFRPAMFKFTDIQTGRLLSDEEVNEMNYIIKRRAYRYIAAAKKDWLYPEDKIKIKRWDKIGKSYLLMPDPRSVTFSSEILIGYDDKRSDAFDEYGRKPWHSDYKDQKRHEDEWESFHAFQGEYARLFGPRRKGIAFNFGEIDLTEDSPDYHAYHLGLEQKFKKKDKKKDKKKSKKA